jgi:hypothetical protein
MNPVSTRGRSMSRDRQTLRALLLTVCIVCSSVSMGCQQSILRKADAPTPALPVSSGTSSGNRAAASIAPGPQIAAAPGDKAIIPSTSSIAASPATAAATPSMELEAAPSPLQAQSAELPLAPEPQAAVGPATPAAAPALDDGNTPMLDAAFERVAALRRQQIASPEQAQETSPAEPDHLRPTPVAPASQVTVPASPAAKKTEPVPPADAAESGPVVAPTLIENDELPSPLAPATVLKEEVPRTVTEPASKADAVPGAGSVAVPEQKPETLPQAPPTSQDVRPTIPATDDVPDPLGISKLRLCRKVNGFGSFDPMRESQVKAGQRILVYCEMTGMQYEPKDASFVSRLTSKIEISSAATGAIQWTRKLGPAEDVCGSRRHDFYVNYRVDLPRTLAPGSYRLRLTQTDMIADRTTSAELPFEIVP